MERPLELLLLDRLKPNHLAEVDWLLSYLNDPARASKFPIFLSLGQAWEKTPSTLIAKMLEIPAFTHGYGLSMYGYPPLRRTLCKYVEEQYGLNPTYHKEYRLYEVAVAQTGTRSCLYNFAAWLKI